MATVRPQTPTRDAQDTRSAKHTCPAAPLRPSTHWKSLFYIEDEHDDLRFAQCGMFMSNVFASLCKYGDGIALPISIEKLMTKFEEFDVQWRVDRDYESYRLRVDALRDHIASDMENAENLDPEVFNWKTFVQNDTRGDPRVRALWNAMTEAVFSRRGRQERGFTRAVDMIARWLNLSDGCVHSVLADEYTTLMQFERV